MYYNVLGVICCRGCSSGQTDRNPCHREAYILVGGDQDYTKEVGKLYIILEGLRAIGKNKAEKRRLSTGLSKDGRNSCMFIETVMI